MHAPAMRRLLMPALCALLLAMLAGCESISAEGVSAGGLAGAAILDAPRRCAQCGWIEAKRELGPQSEHANLPIVYEYTVRMANGSLSVFRQEDAVQWRVGERLIVIAGRQGSANSR